MKNNAITMFLALGAASLCGSALEAQSNNELLSVKVPFVFQAAGETFGAGNYVLGEHGFLGVPSIRNVATGHTILIAGSSRVLTQVGPPRLVFHCYSGKACFLAEIRPAIGAGSRVGMTKAEKEAAASGQHGEIATIFVDVRHAD